jgi:hypothetical protein
MKLAHSGLTGVAFLATAALAFGLLREEPMQGGTVQAPRFEVDPAWTKPLPNNWLLGSVTGVAVDSRDHVYVIHITESFTARTETGAGGANKIS